MHADAESAVQTGCCDRCDAAAAVKLLTVR